MGKDFLSDFLDLNGDGHVTPQEAYIGLQFLETSLHWEPERWDEDGFFDDAADMDDGEGGFGNDLFDDDGDGFDGFDEDGEDDESAGAFDDGEGDGFDDFDDFDSFDEDDGFDDEIDRDGF